MLSLKRGIPIAIVSGGKHDGKTVYVQRDMDKIHKHELDDEDKLNVVANIIYDRTDDHRSLHAKDVVKLENAILNEKPPKEYTLKKLYEAAKEELDRTSGKHLIFDDGTLQAIPFIDPDEKQRNALFISGPSGSGKTTYAVEWIKQYKKIYPKRKIFLFSRKKEDRILDRIQGLVRVLLDDELLEDPIEVDKMKNMLLIFDDIETIPDKKLATYVKNLRDDILEIGRSMGLDVISTSHQLMNWQATRKLISESTDIIFFLRNGTAFHSKNFMSKYCGFDNTMIKKITALRSRWVHLHRNPAPMYVLSEHEVTII